MGKDDEDLFERAMETLGTKRSARAAPRPGKPRPVGVEVVEDLDFDAVMRDGRGPAQDLSAARAHAPDGARRGEAGSGSKGAPEPDHPKGAGERRSVSPAETREFLEAMAALGPVPTKGEPALERAGAGPDLMRRLKRGEVESDALLDLHGSTQKEAAVKLSAFLKEAVAQRWEIVTIVVGRGLRSDRGQAVLRPLVERWLREDYRGEVSEVHEAPSHLGGSGAWIAAIRRRG